MASALSLTLTPNDVPGAVFVHQNVEDHSVVQLRRWLECRGLPTKGKKVDLIERCKRCITAGTDTTIAVGIDGGKWYHLKLQQNGIAAPKINSPPLIPATGWGIFQSFDVPEMFNNGHIYYYLIESLMTADEILAQTEKPLKRGQQYVDSGHITQIYDIKKERFYFLKAIVKSSFRKDVQYFVTVTLSVQSGSIVEGTCECKQSALGRCSHVAAVLLYLLNHVTQFGYAALPATSKPCSWGHGSKSKNPSNIHVAMYSKKRKTDELVKYDPRPSVHETDSLSDAEVNRFISNLQHANDSHNKASQGTMWQTILTLSYSDYDLTPERVVDLKVLQGQFSTSLRVHDATNSKICMVANTIGQSKSLSWATARSIRITSSTAKVACGLSTPTSVAKFLRKHLWGIDIVHTKAMQYGQTCESVARQNYIAYLQQLDPASTVAETGLWVNNSFPQLACSPDGLVNIPSRNPTNGLLEIKCPMILENHDPHDFANVLTSAQLKNFCLVKTASGVELKKAHAYYFQIQMSLGILERKWCDFVVWTRKGMIVLTVDFDDALWHMLHLKLCKFHNTYLSAEYFEMRTVRNLSAYQMI